MVAKFSEDKTTSIIQADIFQEFTLRACRFREPTQEEGAAHLPTLTSTRQRQGDQSDTDQSDTDQSFSAADQSLSRRSGEERSGNERTNMEPVNSRGEKQV